MGRNLIAKQIHSIPKFSTVTYMNKSAFGGVNIMGSDIPESIRKEAMSRDFQVTIRVGKSGITDTLVSEIESQLQKRSLVKIKLNRGLFDRKDISEVWAHLAERTHSTVVLARGNVGVLWR